MSDPKAKWWQKLPVWALKVLAFAAILLVGLFLVTQLQFMINSGIIIALVLVVAGLAIARLEQGKLGGAWLVVAGIGVASVVLLWFVNRDILRWLGFLAWPVRWALVVMTIVILAVTPFVRDKTRPMRAPLYFVAGSLTLATWSKVAYIFGTGTTASAGSFWMKPSFGLIAIALIVLFWNAANTGRQKVQPPKKAKKAKSKKHTTKTGGEPTPNPSDATTTKLPKVPRS